MSVYRRCLQRNRSSFLFANLSLGLYHMVVFLEGNSGDKLA